VGGFDASREGDSSAFQLARSCPSLRSQFDLEPSASREDSEVSFSSVLGADEGEPLFALIAMSDSVVGEEARRG